MTYWAGLASVLLFTLPPALCVAAPQIPECMPFGGGWGATAFADDPRYTDAVPLGEPVRIPVRFDGIAGYPNPEAAQETLTLEVTSEGLVVLGEVRGFQAVGRGVFEAVWASYEELVGGQTYVARITGDNSKLFGCDTSGLNFDFIFTVATATLEALAAEVNLELSGAVETVAPTATACCSTENRSSFQCWDSIVEPRTTARWTGAALPYWGLSMAPSSGKLLPRAVAPFEQSFAVDGDGEYCVAGNVVGRVVEACSTTSPLKMAPSVAGRVRVPASSCDDALDDVTANTWLNVVRAETEDAARAGLAGITVETPTDDAVSAPTGTAGSSAVSGPTETAGSSAVSGPTGTAGSSAVSDSNPVESSEGCSIRPFGRGRGAIYGWSLALIAAVLARRARTRVRAYDN